MKDYHWIWLEAHPHRTEEWLKERMTDGFDIHHVDGDQKNNDPSNLVLIECTDHLMLHAGGGRPSLYRSLDRPEDRQRRQDAGRKAYALRLQGLGWREILEETGASSPASLMKWARDHASRNGLCWPVPIKEET